MRRQRFSFSTTLGILGALLVMLTHNANASPLPIEVDFETAGKPRSTMGTFSVGSDRALIFLRPEHQRDLLALQTAVGFEYLRCHGLFNEEMKIVSRDASGGLSFDWTRVDAFIDQLRAADLKPFFELGFMPEPLASGPQTIFWWRGNVTPPAKMDEWSQLVREFAHHIIARYGIEEVRTWYFEVWNEPNLDGFWTGGQQGYFELYEASARALKAVDPGLRVGGPSTAGLAWIPEFVAFCQANQVPLDFVSSHAYSAMQGFLDEKGEGGGTVLDRHPDALTGGFRQARRDTPEQMPLFITEWGPSYSPRDPVHDSYVCAPFILQKVREAEGLVDGLSYWTFSDQFEEPGPPHTPFHGGFGLMTVDGLRKPAFFAYWMLGRLHSEEIPIEASQTIVTRSEGSLRLVTWDYSPPEQDVPNDPFYHRDLPPTDLEDRKIVISNLPPGTYAIRRFKVGYEHNDLHAAFRKLEDPKSDGAHLAPETLEELERSYRGLAADAPRVVEEGELTLTLPMRTNDAWYVEIERLP